MYTPRVKREKKRLPRKLRLAIFERDYWKCWYCGRQLQSQQCHQADFATVDHRTPEIKGGDQDCGNLVAACLTCNSQKGNRTIEEYRAYLRYTQASNGRAIVYLRAVAELLPGLAQTTGEIIEHLENTLSPTIFYGELSHGID